MGSIQSALTGFMKAGAETYAWDALYKVYAHLEEDKVRHRYILEVIDGYLQQGELLRLQKQKQLADGTLVFVFSISGGGTSTYVEVPDLVFDQENESVLVLIEKKAQLCGYQWIDRNGNCLGVPQLDPKKYVNVV